MSFDAKFVRIVERVQESAPKCRGCEKVFYCERECQVSTGSCTNRIVKNNVIKKLFADYVFTKLLSFAKNK
jgi:hypothetical protein